MKIQNSKLVSILLAGTLLSPKINGLHAKTPTPYNNSQQISASQNPAQGLLGPVSVKKDDDSYTLTWAMSDALQNEVNQNTNVRPYFNVYDNAGYDKKIYSASIVKIEGNNILVKLPKRYFKLKGDSALEYNVGVYSTKNGEGPGSKFNPISAYHGNLWSDMEGQEICRALKNAYNTSKELIDVQEKGIQTQKEIIHNQDKIIAKKDSTIESDTDFHRIVWNSFVRESIENDSLKNALNKNKKKPKADSHFQAGAEMDGDAFKVFTTFHGDDKGNFRCAPYLALSFGSKYAGTSEEIKNKEEVLMGSNTYEHRVDSVKTILKEIPSLGTGVRATQTLHRGIYAVLTAGTNIVKEKSEKTGTATIWYTRGNEILESHKLGDEEGDTIPSEEKWTIVPEMSIGTGIKFSEDFSLEARLKKELNKKGDTSFLLGTLFRF